MSLYVKQKQKANEWKQITAISLTSSGQMRVLQAGFIHLFWRIAYILFGIHTFLDYC